MYVENVKYALKTPLIFVPFKKAASRRDTNSMYVENVKYSEKPPSKPVLRLKTTFKAPKSFQNQFRAFKSPFKAPKSLQNQFRGSKPLLAGNFALATNFFARKVIL